MQQKLTPFYKLSRVMLVIIASLICSFLLATGLKPDVCIGLRPYNNLDELLYQIYINLGSDCLFTMPVSQLEQIWDTKILSLEETTSGKYFQIWSGSDFYKKPYKSEKDAFFVEKRANEKFNRTDFHIIITDDYLKKYGTLFPDGKFPKQLPVPLRTWSHSAVYWRGNVPGDNFHGKTSTGEELYATEEIPNAPAKTTTCALEPVVAISDPEPSDAQLREYHGGNTYYWLNLCQTHMIYTEVISGPITGITVTNQVHPSYKTFPFWIKQ